MKFQLYKEKNYPIGCGQDGNDTRFVRKVQMIMGSKTICFIVEPNLSFKRASPIYREYKKRLKSSFEKGLSR